VTGIVAASRRAVTRADADVVAAGCADEVADAESGGMEGFRE
jgi:hypothetical protein